MLMQSRVWPFTNKTRLFTSDVIFPLDLREVCLYLQPLAHQWHKLGEELHLSSTILDKIEQSSHEDVMENLKNVMEEWLKHSELSPCWGTLMGALQELHMDAISTSVTSNHGMSLGLV